MRRPWLVLVTLLLGCGGSSTTGAQPDPSAKPEHDKPAPSQAPTPPGPPTNAAGADELHELEGQPRAAIVERFGEPTRKREFTMADCCSEFSIELLNTYPPKAGHDAVVIHEWTWDYDGYALTIWFHQQDGEWRALETSRYSDDVRF